MSATTALPATAPPAGHTLSLELKRQGNSLCVVLPRKLLRELGLDVGDRVLVTLEDAALNSRKERMMAARGRFADWAMPAWQDLHDEEDRLDRMADDGLLG